VSCPSRRPDPVGGAPGLSCDAGSRSDNLEFAPGFFCTAEFGILVGQAGPPGGHRRELRDERLRGRHHLLQSALLAPDREQLHRIHLEEVVRVSQAAGCECLQRELLCLRVGEQTRERSLGREGIPTLHGEVSETGGREVIDETVAMDLEQRGQPTAQSPHDSPLARHQVGEAVGSRRAPLVYLDAGDERYILHFNSAGVYLVLGPLYIATGLVDTD
jgi:hypothetical protein